MPNPLRERWKQKDKCYTCDILIKRESDFLRYGYALLNMLSGKDIQLEGGEFTFARAHRIIQKINEAARKAREETKNGKISAPQS